MWPSYRAVARELYEPSPGSSRAQVGGRTSSLLHARTFLIHSLAIIMILNDKQLQWETRSLMTLAKSLISLASHTLQSAGKEGLVTSSCSGGITKRSRVTANHAGPAICARAASKAAINSNLIGRDQILSPEQLVVRASLPDPLSLEIEGCG